MRSKSAASYETARLRIPGGVNSPVRAYGQVGVHPPIIAASAQGAYLTDIDGKRYVDYIGAWGPLILGHADADVVSAVQAASSLGLGFGVSTEAESQMAQLLCELMPSLQKVRLVNSGTEATMTAIRLARAFTKRNKIIKFEGCYHGHSDALLVKSGSGLATLAANSNSTLESAPSSAGVEASVTAQTVVLPFNDLPAVTAALKTFGTEVAGLILEPVVGNMGCVPPEHGYLQGLRKLCDQYQIVLIMDEVMTGFRVALGGAQARYGVSGDLTTLSKIIGGGLPVGAVGGRAEIIDLLAPLGPVYQAGTLSGNPVTVAAGMATLRKLRGWSDPKTGRAAFEQLEFLGERLESALKVPLAESGLPVTLQRVGSMFTLFFVGGRVRNFQESARGDHSSTGPYALFYQELLNRGVLFPPSSFEAAFISLAHTPNEIDLTVKAIAAALAIVKQRWQPSWSN